VKELENLSKNANRPFQKIKFVVKYHKEILNFIRCNKCDDLQGAEVEKIVLEL